MFASCSTKHKWIHAALTRARPSVLVLQVLLGWKYGDSVDEKAKIHPQLRTYKSLTEKVANVESEIQKYRLQRRQQPDLIRLLLSLLQEKEIYRWPIRETLKSMLAMGWSIDRTKDGESMSQQRESEKMRKISQVSQVNAHLGERECLKRDAQFQV